MSKVKEVMRVAALIIPILALVSPLCRGSDPIAEIAGVCELGEECRLLRKKHLDGEFARYTNAVVVIDGVDKIRTAYRLARDGEGRWITSAAARIDLKTREIDGMPFGGLNRGNCAFISIEGGDGLPTKSTETEFPDGTRETIEIWKGSRIRRPNDSYNGYLGNWDNIPIEDEAGWECYFKWPDNRFHPKWPDRMGRRRREEKPPAPRLLVDTRLWVARLAVEGKDGRTEFWDFDYREAPTADEIRAELLRLTTERGKAKIFLSAPLKTD